MERMKWREMRKKTLTINTFNTQRYQKPNGKIQSRRTKMQLIRWTKNDFLSLIASDTNKARKKSRVLGTNEKCFAFYFDDFFFCPCDNGFTLRYFVIYTLTYQIMLPILNGRQKKTYKITVTNVRLTHSLLPHTIPIRSPCLPVRLNGNKKWIFYSNEMLTDSAVFVAVFFVFVVFFVTSKQSSPQLVTQDKVTMTTTKYTCKKKSGISLFYRTRFQSLALFPSLSVAHNCLHVPKWLCVWICECECAVSIIEMIQHMCLDESEPTIYRFNKSGIVSMITTEKPLSLSGKQPNNTNNAHNNCSWTRQRQNSSPNIIDTAKKKI